MRQGTEFRTVSVSYVPVHHAIDPADSTLYDVDRVHPSVRASSVMAHLLADAIKDFQ